ncbi:MAG: glycosyltransferase family 2 protein [Acidobacteriales bacterium]|nr:glycosyltransferase family 2 protein [Terriglobales bacterium]
MNRAEQESVSIIVPCRNEEAHVDLFIASLLRQELDGIDSEVLIADGISDDGTREKLAKWANQHPWMRVIDNPERIVSTGLNRAIRESRGEYILRMDLHTEYAPDYVRRCLEVLKETGADNAGGPALTRSESLVGRAIAAAYHSWFACGGARFHDADYEGPADTVPYGCWHRSVFERIGLFDEALVRNQDDEFNLRILKHGGKIWQSPKIVSWYKPRNTLRALFRQYFQYGFWKIPVIRKHRQPASWRHLIPGSFVICVAAMPAAATLLLGTGRAELSGFVMSGWLGLVGVYGIVACMAAVAAGRSEWKIVPVLPAVFFTYHAAYGVGFLVGMLYWSFRSAQSAKPVRWFTSLSR